MWEEELEDKGKDEDKDEDWLGKLGETRFVRLQIAELAEEVL